MNYRTGLLSFSVALALTGCQKEDAAPVLQNTTSRWSTYDTVRHNLPLMEDVHTTIQERAWTSPIWYTP